MAVSGTKGVGKGPFGTFATGNGIPEGTGAVGRSIFLDFLVRTPRGVENYLAIGD